MEKTDGKTLATLRVCAAERRQRLAWRNNEELLASVFEMLSAIRREQLLVAGVPASDAPDVIRYPRPGQEHAVREDTRKRCSARQLADLLKK